MWSNCIILPVETIYGSAYVNVKGDYGVASYHFEELSKGGSYISYEKAPTHYRTHEGAVMPIHTYFTDGRTNGN